MGRFRCTHHNLIKHKIEGKFGRKTGEDVLLKIVGRVGVPILGKKLGPLHRLRETGMFQPPPLKRQKQ